MNYVSNMNLEAIQISSPISDNVIAGLRVGQKVLLSGIIYTARDAAHKKIVAAIQNGENYGFDIAGQTVYYAGPCPARPGSPIGPIGPTTSGRMDAYTPYLLERGLKAMIGKGLRCAEVKETLTANRAIYLAAIGGAAAVMMRCVKTAEFVAFDELGTEAVRKLTVEKMPLIVAMDIYGGDIYST
jgi:fumarate hydratase subunit beta